MSKFIKRISVILCLAMVFGARAACSGNEVKEPEDSLSESVSESTPSATPDESQEEETFETELVEDLVTFVDYTRSSRTYHDLKSGNVAMSFTIPEGQMKKLYLNLTDIYGLSDCSIQLDIYAFDGDYKDSKKTEPIYSEYITSSYRTYTVEFEDGQMPAGDYLVILSYVEPEAPEEDSTSESGEEVPAKAVHTKVIVDNFWYNTTLPEEYEQYNLRSYTKDKANKKTSFCGGFVIEHTQNVIKEETDGDEIYEYPDNTAKVILIGGQSNATGASYGSFLKQNVTDEQYQEYVNGYSHVKILYSSGTLSNGLPSVRNKTM